MMFSGGTHGPENSPSSERQGDSTLTRNNQNWSVKESPSSQTLVHLGRSLMKPGPNPPGEGDYYSTETNFATS